MLPTVSRLPSPARQASFSALHCVAVSGGVWKGKQDDAALFRLGEWSDTRASITELGQRDLHSDQRAYLSCTEAMLATLTGDAARAAACLEGHAARLTGTELVTARATYLMDRALMSLATGDIEAAWRESIAAVSADPMGINSPHAMAVQAHAALWLQNAEGVRAALAGMKAFHWLWLAASRVTVEAGLAALEGRAQEATETYQEAIKAWRALECTLDLALCELDRTLLLGPNHPDAFAAVEARDIFTELGAKPFLERLDRAERGAVHLA